ncbi:MAG: acetyl-CoA carboxylase biotin carboxyl carrier protein [Candidatus Limnocylindrales bacterium]
MSDIHDEPKKGQPGGSGAPEIEAGPTPPSAETASLMGLIDRLGSLLERSDLIELEVESGGTGIVLRKPSALAPQAPAAPPPAPASAPVSADATAGVAAASVADSVEPPPPATTKTVKAPLTGIFYAAPSPASPPYVTVGQHVVAGQVIGLIEAMKLFNEIKSDLSGSVVRIVAETGKLVKAKQPLIEVEP